MLKILNIRWLKFLALFSSNLGLVATFLINILEDSLAVSTWMAKATALSRQIVKRVLS